MVVDSDDCFYSSCSAMATVIYNQWFACVTVSVWPGQELSSSGFCVLLLWYHSVKAELPRLRVVKATEHCVLSIPLQ